MQHVTNERTIYMNTIEYDRIYPIVKAHYERYTSSSYSELEKGEYECMTDYLDNRVTEDRYTIEVVDWDKYGDTEVELHLKDTKLDRNGKPLSATGLVSIEGMDMWGEHGFGSYVTEYGFSIIDNQIISSDGQTV
jgi:hypothetical protein